jgi:TonB family protein
MRVCRRIAVFAPAALLLSQTWSARPPRVVSRSEPEYSEEARRASVNTTIAVSLVVNENGVPEDIKVVQGAGFGLDEMAIRAIETWRFEPGTKEGKPTAAAIHVEVSFRLFDRTRAGQTARLNFNLAPDVERPELIKGKIPSNPDPPGRATMRVRFTVGTDGRPKNFQTFDTDSLEWSDRAVHEMAGWRFRPARRAGQPEEVNGIFELTVRPENRPSLRRSLGTAH